MKRNEEHELIDDRLIEQYRLTRSDADFMVIVGRFRRLLVKYARGRCRASVDETLDAIQYTWTWLIENIDYIDSNKPVLHQLANAMQRGIYRSAPQRIKKNPVVFFTDIGDSRKNAVDFSDTIADPSSMQADEDDTAIAQRLERVEVVREALAELSPTVRESVTIRYQLNGVPFKAMGGVAGKSWVTIKEQVKMARTLIARNSKVRELYILPPVEPTPKRERLLNDLSQKQKLIVRYVHEQGLSQQEAARRLGVYPQIVFYNWKSALKKIARSKELQTLTGIGPGMYGI